MTTLSYKASALNLEFVAGDDVRMPITVSGITNNVTTPVDLTGSVIKANIAQTNSVAQALVEITFTNTDAVNGKASGYISDTVTASLNTGTKAIKYIWELQITNASGDTRTYASGTVTVYPQVKL